MLQTELVTIRVHGHSKTRIRTVEPWVRIPLTFSRCWYRQCLCDRLIPRQRTPKTCLKDLQFQKLFSVRTGQTAKPINTAGHVVSIHIH